MDFSLISTVYAAEDVLDLVKKIDKVIINPALGFFFIVAFLYFLYGVMEFLRNAANADARTKGNQHMLWGAIGMAIMMSVFGIMSLLINTFGVRGIDTTTGVVELPKQ